MVIVIDYNVGNVKSVCNAFSSIGCDSRLSSDPTTIKDAGGLVLPGVAAFGYAMGELGNLAELVRELALEGKPLLGICVGYQLLFDKSFEHGEHQGLGLVHGNVIPIPTSTVIPHMGWNMVQMPEDMNLFAGLPREKHFYFAHSYYADVKDSDTKIAYTEYGFDLSASVQKQNIYGTQFHPEKSGPTGLKMLENFAAICQGGKG